MMVEPASAAHEKTKLTISASVSSTSKKHSLLSFRTVGASESGASRYGRSKAPRIPVGRPASNEYSYQTEKSSSRVVNKSEGECVTGAAPRIVELKGIVSFIHEEDDISDDELRSLLGTLDWDRPF